MQKTPHMLIEGIVIAVLRGRRQPLLHLHPRRVRAAGRHPRRGARRSRARPATSASDILGSGHSLSLVLHRGAGAYICGEETGAARLAGGQARQPAAEAAVPRQPGPLPGPDADQQRRDARDGARDHRAWAARSTRSSAPRPRPAPSSSRVSGHVQRPGNYEIELGHPLARDHLRARRRPARGAPVKCWFPGGSSAPVLTAADLDVPYDFDSLAKAGSMLGSGAIIVVDDSTPIMDVAHEGRRSSTATSPAASARRAARAPTGR